MRSLISRFLLTVAAAIFGFGAAMHLRAFLSKASYTIDQAQLPHFMASELKVLWLADSTTLFLLAIGAAYMALKPSPNQAPFLFLLAAVPAATAILLYTYLGLFYAADMLLAASLMVVVASQIAKWPSRQIPKTEDARS